MKRIPLPGCAPTPLARYLKALGVLRLVAEGPDPEALGYWQGDEFVLESARLDAQELERFLLHDYVPTPIVAPWNGGSGFYPKDRKDGIEPLGGAQARRFAPYAEVIGLGFEALAAAALETSPKDEEKADLLARLRGQLPEYALQALDAGVVLAGEDPRYPPLFGTGWNDGRLEFSNNFMQRLVELFDPDSGAPSTVAEQWLPGALWGEPTPGLTKGAIGQFAPGNAGGPNASVGFEGASLINPWDFVLMLEGGLLFAAAATRRLESHEAAAMSFPFTVRPTRAGSGSASGAEEGSSRAEMWLPLWERPASYAELRGLLVEGRATLGRRPARDGLDFARSVAGLGVDRGIRAFQRYAFVQRSGKAFLAAPLDRFPVPDRPSEVAGLLADLDRHGFLDRLRGQARGKDAPGRLQSLVRRLEDAIYGLARGNGNGRPAAGQRLREILVLLGRLQAYVGHSPSLRERVPPVPVLRSDWAVAADDGSPEFHVAAALASLLQPSAGELSALPMRAFLAPVVLAGNRWEWDPESRTAVWGEGDLLRNLLAVLERRLLEWRWREHAGSPFQAGLRADAGSVAAFLAGETDDDRIAELLPGLALAWPPESLPARESAAPPLPVAFSVLKPFFVPGSLLAGKWLPAGRECAFPDAGPLVAKLQAGALEGGQGALPTAWRMARGAGLSLPETPGSPPAANMDSQRLAAALLVPMNVQDTNVVLGKIYRKPEVTHEHTG